MFLSEMLIDSITPGLRVVGANGVKGSVTRIIPEGREDNIVCIDWDDRKKSQLWHFWCEHIKVDE